MEKLEILEFLVIFGNFGIFLKVWVISLQIIIYANEEFEIWGNGETQNILKVKKIGGWFKWF